ncbi:MAG: hypothetical protein HZB55_04695 [Deltaproteobacteria bacterium]|nr:hypothetical protein [Deltaproteobacteria bacterium]
MAAAAPRRLQGYLLGRAVVLVALLALAAWAEQQGWISVAFAGLPMATAASFAVTLVSALASRSGLWPGALARLQPTWDAAYVTALVYLSGGAFSPFATLYPLAIIGGAILLYRRGALVTATTSSLAYGLLVDLQVYGLLRPPGAASLSPELGAQLLPHLGSNVAAFYALALLAGHLAEELRRIGQRLEAAQAEVLDLELLQDSILRSLGSGLVAVDSGGRALFHNRAAEELLGRAGLALRAGSVLGEIFDLSGAERREVAFADGATVLGYSSLPLFDREGRGRGSILIFQDVTQIKRLEEDLNRADRLAAVGRLAAGLAHEIRNPLASLAGAVEVLRESLSPGEEEKQLFAIVLRETERLNRLVTNFLHYARPGRAQQATFDLRTLVEETGFFFTQGEGRNGFHLSCRIPDDLTLHGDRDQMAQLFLNLLRNSREASPEDVAVEVEAARDQGGVTVTIRDDGPGMAPDVAARAFEPFFSCREGGTGLGLATVHRIVENHGGTVELDTAPDRGTTFRLQLPVGERLAFGGQVEVDRGTLS